MITHVETAEQLDKFYIEPDPWNYHTTPDDRARLATLLAALPKLQYRRALDIGCGNAFVTECLPGEEVVGCDLSAKAIDWARERVALRPDAHRFTFHALSLFDLSAAVLGRFDSIVITGVLYPQYIGNGFSVVRAIVDDLLLPGGILTSCHIASWSRWRFPLTLVSEEIYEYREYVHHIEVFSK